MPTAEQPKELETKLETENTPNNEQPVKEAGLEDKVQSEADALETEVMPKEDLTQIEVPDYVPKEFVDNYREFAEHYGKELADYCFQDKIEIKVLAEKLGLKLKRLYSFPMLENSLINRKELAVLIDTEGGVYFRPKKKERYNYIEPQISFVNTSKELAERVAAWMGVELPKPTIGKGNRLPAYRLGKSSTLAIELVYLIRLFLRKKENIENADKIIESLKDKASIRCDENGNPIPRPEPKYVTAYRLRQEGLSYKEIGQRLGCSPYTISAHLSYAKNPEFYRKRKQERCRLKR